MLHAEASKEEKSTTTSNALICRMIFDELCVNANGDIVCSCADPAGIKVYGNIHRDRIADVYNGEAYQAMRQSQLEADGTPWCSVTKAVCSGKVSRPTWRDQSTERVVRLLQLEPTSFCNLRCPGCPSTVMAQGIDANYQRGRRDMLSLEAMLDVVDQLPYLEKILFYNFGEPFLHSDAIPFLREVRRRRPDVLLHTNTNGTLLRQPTIEAIASEKLLDLISFSIDGSRQHAYERYRVRGRLDRALANMSALVHACHKFGSRRQIEIHWQYILFDWNDGDEDIAEARSTAKFLGVPIKWIVTHSEGASRRYAAGSGSLKQLIGSADTYSALDCDMRARDKWDKGGIVNGTYAAELSADASSITSHPDAPFEFSVDVTNTAPDPWPSQSSYRLGMQLQTIAGRQLYEMPAGGPLSQSLSVPGARASFKIKGLAPSQKGTYSLLVDVVHQDVCWFSERGSMPLILELCVT